MGKLCGKSVMRDRSAVSLSNGESIFLLFFSASPPPAASVMTRFNGCAITVTTVGLLRILAILSPGQMVGLLLLDGEYFFPFTDKILSSVVFSA